MTDFISHLIELNQRKYRKIIFLKIGEIFGMGKMSMYIYSPIKYLTNV